MPRHRSVCRRAGGFTLIEILVVIAIIALLIGILLPALGQARMHGRMAREHGVGKQQVTGYMAYCADFKDQCIPAAPEWGWAHGIGRFAMQTGDPFDTKGFLHGTISKVWTLHFAGTLQYPMDAVQLDKATYSDFMSRPNVPGISHPDPPNNGLELHDYGADTRATAFAYHPSLGLNGVYVGGAYTHGAFRNLGPGSSPQGNTRANGGTFWVTNISKVQSPQKLLIFAGSRGGDVREGGTWSWGATNPDSGVIRPGYFIVTAPRPSPTGRGGSSVQLGGGWNTSNTFNANLVPSAYGMVHPRYFSRATTAMFDGHVEGQTIEQLRDMRKWSNYANRPDWNFVPGP